MSNFEPIRFGKYLIIDKIATGGMAELFQAKITSVEGFEKLVAIKKILPNLSQDKNLVDMFIDEAKLAAMLTHQNIAQIYDLGSMEGAYFIAMEYISGKDLRIIINKSKQRGLPISLEHALFITSRICSGLDYSHNLKDFQGTHLKLIHRDISPQNILVTYEGEIKIVDFGIAKAAKKTSDTREGLIKGKVAYMSPEQASGKPIDNRSDIFSAGILLWELVTGERMFAGTDLKVLDRVRKADFKPAEEIVPDLPSEVIGILNKALAKAPSRRYKSCAAMQADLEKCLSSFDVRPSTEGLSQYMKGLFVEEIAAEFAALRRAEVQIPTLKEETVVEGSTKTLPILEHIEPVSGTKPEATQATHRLWLGTWAVAMVAIAVILALFFKDKSLLRSEKGVTPPSSQTIERQQAGKALTSSASTEAAEKSKTVSKPSEFERGMEALKQERYANAASLFEKALASEPGARSRIAKPYAQALVAGAASILDSNPRKAANLLRKASSLDPKNSEAYYYLGKLHTAKKDYPKAIKAYKRAIRLDPRSPDAFFNLGFIYYSTKEYSKAEKMFHKVVELRPFYLDEAYFNLAVVQNLQGKKRESIANLERTLEVNPNNNRAKKYLLRLKRTSQSGNENKQLENRGVGVVGTGTPDDPSRVRYHRQVCGADPKEASLLV